MNDMGSARRRLHDCGRQTLNIRLQGDAFAYPGASVSARALPFEESLAACRFIFTRYPVQIGFCSIFAPVFQA